MHPGGLTRPPEELPKSFMAVLNRAGSEGDWKINVSEGWVVEKIKRMRLKPGWPDSGAIRAREGKVDVSSKAWSRWARGELGK